MIVLYLTNKTASNKKIIPKSRGSGDVLRQSVNSNSDIINEGALYHSSMSKHSHGRNLTFASQQAKQNVGTNLDLATNSGHNSS